jgi:hypothetical protein
VDNPDETFGFDRPLCSLSFRFPETLDEEIDRQACDVHIVHFSKKALRTMWTTPRKVSSTRLVHYFRFTFAFLVPNSKSPGLLDDSSIDSIVQLPCLMISNRHITKNAQAVGLLDDLHIDSLVLKHRLYCPVALLVYLAFAFISLIADFLPR